MTRSAFTKEDLGHYVLEATLIVFSVMLALFLDSVLEDRREERTINELAGHLADEITSNLAVVEEWLPYHREVIDEIDRYLDSDELLQSLLTADGIDYGRLMEKGLIQDFYSSSSWQLAQQSEITSRIEFDVSLSGRCRTRINWSSRCVSSVISFRSCPASKPYCNRNTRKL